jgi:hypothetical protein
VVCNFEVPSVVAHVAWIVVGLLDYLQIIVEEMCGWSKAIVWDQK